MLTRRQFVSLLGALPVTRLLPGVRVGCEHRWKGFKRCKSLGRVREWLKGQQCQDCGHIRVAERVTIRWGHLGP